MTYLLSNCAKLIRDKGKLLSSDRNSLIDVLRGLSICMVVFSHFNLLGNVVNTSKYHVFSRGLNDITQGMGYYGVVVFFVISGFLITSMTVRRYGSLPNIDISEFWWFRFSRIMPMLILCILSIVFFNLYGLPQFTVNTSNNLIRGVTAILAFRFNEIMGTVLPGSWNVLWSLSVEEMFYLFFPLLCILLTGVGSIIWIFLVILSSIIYLKYSNTVSPFSTLANVDYLALGCISALAKPYYLTLFRSNASIATARWILILFGLGIICFCVLISNPFETHGYTLFCSIGAALYLIGSQLGISLKRSFYLLFPISASGVISYELYLIHMPLREILYLYGIQNLFWQTSVIFITAILLHLTFSEPVNYILRNWFKINAEGHNPSKKLIYHVLPYVFIIIIVPLFCLNLENKSITLKIVEVVQLPVKTVEPIAVLGYHGHGDMVFLKHSSVTTSQIGIDHWGSYPTLSQELPNESIINRLITIKFGSSNTEVLIDHQIVVSNNEVPFSASKKIEIGSNTQGFSFAIPKSISEIHVLK